MEKRVIVLLGLIGGLFFVLLVILFINDDGGVESISVENGDEFVQKGQFTDSSYWPTYTSEEYAYKMKYPPEWEFNLTDGTTFHPEVCARNKYDKCVGRVSVGVYADADDSVDLSKKCANIEKVSLRSVSGVVWVCDVVMSDEFAVVQGYNRKKEYYFKDGRGNIFEIDLMYVQGEDIHMEQEMIQTITLRSNQ